MTYREAVCRGESLLKEKGIADAGCDAWLLLSMVCGIDRNFYYMHMNDAMAAGHQLEYEKVLNIRAGSILRASRNLWGCGFWWTGTF